MIHVCVLFVQCAVVSVFDPWYYHNPWEASCVMGRAQPVRSTGYDLAQKLCTASARAGEVQPLRCL